MDTNESPLPKASETSTSGQKLVPINTIVSDDFELASSYDNYFYNYLKESIKEYGLLNPIHIDNRHNLIHGKARLRIYKELGYKEIPAIIIDRDIKL